MFVKHFPLILAGTMRTVLLRPRDKKIAKNAAKTALLATAALAIAYAVTPSPLTAVATAATAMVQNRAFHESMQMECHWRKFYDREDFDFETWSDSRCQSYLHFPKAGVEELARLFFLPAMRFRASSGYVNALHYDDNDEPFWVTRNRGKFSLMECVTTVLLRMRAWWYSPSRSQAPSSRPPIPAFARRGTRSQLGGLDQLRYLPHRLRGQCWCRRMGASVRPRSGL